MKTQNLILGLVVIFFISCCSVYSQPFEMIEIGTGSDPHWSPDGTKLAYVLKGTLFVSKADGKGEKETIGPLPWGALHFAWLDSNRFIFWGGHSFREKDIVSRKNVIQTMTLDGKEKLIAESVSRGERATPFDITAPISFPDGMVGYYEVPYMKYLWETEDAVFKVIKWGKLPPDSALKQMRVIQYDLSKTGEYVDRSIWLESADRMIKTKVARCDYCSFPKSSPDGTKILVLCGGTCAVCVVDLEGNINCVGKEDMRYSDPVDSVRIEWGMAPLPDWSPDGKKIAYAYVKAKGNEHNVFILESEIYIENLDGSERIEATHQLNKSLGSPVWSPDGTRIACVELHTSKIYVIKLK